MPHLNANIPFTEGYVRNNYIIKGAINGASKCWIFGVKTILNRPLMFHCQIETGAVFFNLPISAFSWKEQFSIMGDSEEEHISNLLWWDCQASYPSCNCFWYLKGYRCSVKTRYAGLIEGEYLFTIDESCESAENPLGYADHPSSKCFHVIKLDNGFFGAYDNSHIRWYNKNFVDPNSPMPNYTELKWHLSAESFTKTGAIYKITSPENKIYIGQSRKILKRYGNYKNIQCKNQTSLYSSMKIHGFDKHKMDILETCSWEDLNSRESYWIEFYNSFEDGFNHTTGGIKGFKSRKKSVVLSDIARKNISSAAKETRKKYFISKEIPVRCIQTGVVYKSAADAARSLGSHRRANKISECCRGKRKTSFGYNWGYA